MSKPKGKSKRQSKPKPLVKATTFSSRTEAQSLIRKYHEFQKRKTQAEADPTLSEQEKQSQLAELDSKIEDLGGIDQYQKASLHGESFHKYHTSKWTLKEVRKTELFQQRGDRKLALLDVGSLTNHYKTIPWLEVTAIDINPQNESVQKLDFFDLKRPDNTYDLIVLSLVINFVGDVRKRGEMLFRSQKMLKVNGHAFIVLPLACVGNSRYMTHDLFVSFLKSLGFEVVQHKESSALVFYHVRLKTKVKNPPPLKRQFVRPGNNRNNFCIVFSTKKQSNQPPKMSEEQVEDDSADEAEPRPKESAPAPKVNKNKKRKFEALNKKDTSLPTKRQKQID